MAVDWTVRCLTRLQSASSSRVLNLAAIAVAQAGNEDHARLPFFKSLVLNRSIILKHRLRGDETDAFTQKRPSATKVIVPFEISDLRAGGRSLFIGQRGYEDMLQDIGNYKDIASLERDKQVLALLDKVPSLDPFLLREHMRAHNLAPAGCYFQISTADQKSMFDHAAQEVGRLTSIALGGGQSSRQSESTGKMVSALLSNEVTEKLEPLRLTLNLSAAEFSEGVFSWRGFLYYKWNLGQFWPSLVQVLQEIKSIRPINRMTSDEAAYMESIKIAIIRGIQAESTDVRRILGVYDDAYGRLLDSKNPQLFRDFLLSAPSFFIDIGEKMGSMSHVVSFWRYRFPAGQPRTADADELTAIFQDFSRSLVSETAAAA